MKRTEWAKEKTVKDREVQPFDHLARWVTAAFICTLELKNSQINLSGRLRSVGGSSSGWKRAAPPPRDGI